MKINSKTMRDIEESLSSAAYIANDAAKDHENDQDQCAYEYFRGKAEAFKKALEIVKVLGS